MPVPSRTLDLVDRIYAAAIEPRAWEQFVEDLSEALGGAAILLSLQFPSQGVPPTNYRAGIDAQHVAAFAQHAAAGTIPWWPPGPSFRGSFGSGAEIFPDEQLTTTGFYKDWMEPHGLPPEAPLGTVIAETEGRVMSMLSIFRRQGGRCLGSDDLALLDALAPHLQRAYQIDAQMRERIAVASLLDRLPSGTIFLDRQKHPVLVTRTAQTVLRAGDGLRVDGNRIYADNRPDDAALQTLIDRIIAEGMSELTPTGRAISIGRRRSAHALAVYVTPLLDAPASATLRDAAVALVISDPDLGGPSSSEVLEGLYNLSPAEAAIVALLASGRSLAEAAAERDVTIHTARSQLKNVFAKTGTHRQGELLQLVLSGIRDVQRD